MIASNFGLDYMLSLTVNNGETRAIMNLDNPSGSNGPYSKYHINVQHLNTLNVAMFLFDTTDGSVVQSTAW